MQRVVVVALHLRYHWWSPVRLAAVAVEPHDDEAVPVHYRVAADLHVVLALLPAVRDERIRSIDVPLPTVPGALDLIAHDGATNSKVSAQVLAVRVRHRQPA